MTFRRIIDAFGTSRLADLLAVDESHVRTMKTRDSIPPEYWSRIVAGAALHGIEDVSLDVLTRAREDRFRRKDGEVAA